MNGGATEKSSGKTCPSAPPEPGSDLLGLVVGKGQVAYLSPSIPVTPALLARLDEQRVPIENRVRFSGACMEHGCVQWRGEPGAGRCGLIDHAIEALAITSSAEELPRCGIRQTCRWYAQHKAAACAVCPEVIRRPATD